MLIVGNGHVVTRDAKNQYFPDGAVAIHDNLQRRPDS